MKKSIGLWQLGGFAVTALCGTLLHYLYEWLGKPIWIAPFSGVNESTWEHMKLLFWPMLLFGVIQAFFFKDYPVFFCVKLRGILLGISLIPIIFYTYNGVIGESADWFNIAIFFISSAAAYIYEARLLGGRREIRCKMPKLAVLILCAVGTLFIIFTFFTPHINIFKDPLSGTYGII